MPRVSTQNKQPSPVQVLIGNQDQNKPAQAAPPEVKEERIPTWFWDKVAALPAEDWKNGIYELWIIRQADSKVPMAPGEKGYLDIFMEPITPGVIKHKYGGGKFTIVLNMKGRFVTSHNFEIEGAPIYDNKRERPGASPAVAATVAGNTDVLTQFVGVLREELNHARERSDTANPATERALDLLSEASKKAMETVQAQIPTAASATNQFRDMVAAFKDIGIIGGAGSGKSTLGSLIEELSPLIALLTPVLGKFFTPQDPLSQASMFLGLMDKMDELRGKGGTARGANTNDLILEAIKTFPDVLAKMQEGKQTPQQIEEARRAHAVALEIQRRAALPPPGTQPGQPQHVATQPAPQNPGRTIATTSPAASAPGAPMMIPGPLNTVPFNRDGKDADPTVGLPPPVNVGAPTMAPADRAARYDELLKENIYRMVELELDGGQIAEFIDAMKPAMIKDLAAYSIEQLEQFFAMDPILALAMKLPRWRLCLEEVKFGAQEMMAEENEEVDAREPAKVN